MWFSLLSLVLGTALAGSLLAWLASNSGPVVSLRKIAKSAPGNSDDAPPPVQRLIEVVNQTLPQTQCAQCGHPGCRPYAEAIINQNAPINQCPPGGQSLIDELAELLGRESVPLDTSRGDNKPAQVAYIDESLCIGCTLCIDACPVDAIVGASRQMHTIITDQCTGCELCLPPCPVDCISLEPASRTLDQWRWPKPVISKRS